MPCESVRLPDGTTAIVCSRGGRRPKGKACFAQACRGPAYWQCDFELPDGKVCDRWCCERHRRGVGPNEDHCLEHFFKKRDR